MIREKLVKEETHDPGLPHALHVFRPAGDHVQVRPYPGKTVRHAGFAEEAFKERIFEIFAHLQFLLGELPDVDVVPPGYVPFISRNFKYGAVGLAKAAPVAFGNFFVHCLILLFHDHPSNERWF
jgi:hypothetical protein